MSISDFENEEVSKTEWDEGTKEQQTPVPLVESPVETATPVSTTPVSTPPPNTDEILASLMGKIQPIGQNANFKIMIYGDPGSTKSSFTATAPNNLIVDLEDGLISAKSSPNGIADNVQAFPWQGFDALGALIGKFMEGAEPLKQFSVLSIDSFSELQKRALAEITEREWRKRPSANRFVAETEHHVENNERMMRMVRALRDLNRDLIITSHAKTVEPKGKPAKTYADFSESLSNKIMAMMDIVGYMSVKTIDGVPTPVLRVVTDGTIHCKTRVPLPAEILNPTYSGLRRAWEEASKNN